MDTDWLEGWHVVVLPLVLGAGFVVMLPLPVACVFIVLFVVPWGLSMSAYVRLEQHRRDPEELRAAGIEYPKLWWFSDYVNPKWYDEAAGPDLSRFRTRASVTILGALASVVAAAAYLLSGH